MMSAKRKTGDSKPVEKPTAQTSITERLERLAAQHPKLVRALEKEDPTELYR